MRARNLFPLATVATLALSAAASCTTPHKVVSTILESGNPGQTLSSGNTTMETATTKCPRTTCTVSMEIMANVGKATCTDEWKIIGLVDGNSVDGGPYLSQLPGSGRYQTRNWQGQYTLANGRHTFAFQIYVPCSANAYQWSVNYMLTTP